MGRATGRKAQAPDEVLTGIADSASFISGAAVDVDGGASLNVIPGAGD